MRHSLTFMTIACMIFAGGTAEERKEGAPSRRPFILLTNDDGFEAAGLKAILEELEKVGEVLVAAPARDRSGASQSIQLDGPVRVRAVAREGGGEPVYAVDGPPATCVLLAAEHLARGRRFDLAVSGLNHGENLGLDLPSSGTVGGARMAADLGIPAVALSLAFGSKEFRAAAGASLPLIRAALEQGRAGEWEKGLVLNANFPRGAPAAWKKPVLVRPGGRGFVLMHRVNDPQGGEMLFEPHLGLAAGPFPEGSDARALAEGHITVTPAGNAPANGEVYKSLAAWKIFR
ncbi:MAG: 5'/3'-nucleotidase SurE [Planctomycetes bacterium]|nr:5'/3'-nucleotidase SurE [Planctomycetota bacterium]